MNNCLVFMLDSDKDFLKLYSTLLNRKGCQVFATDNLFLLLKYAKTSIPSWIFIDEDFAQGNIEELLNILDKNIASATTKYTIMNHQKNYSTPHYHTSTDYIYKPLALEKMMQLAENCCIMQ